MLDGSSIFITTYARKMVAVTVPADQTMASGTEGVTHRLAAVGFFMDMRTKLRCLWRQSYPVLSSENRKSSKLINR